jgi:GYF domain 2
MLDSGCMMLDDQEMTEEWIVRVQGKEYGPADIETLREWKADGRLLPGNEARRADVDLWTTAAEIPGLFDAAAPVATSTGRPVPPPLQPRRGLAQILAETFWIYRKGFLQFLGLALVVAVPSIAAQLTSATSGTSPNVEPDFRTLIAAAFGLCMTVLTMVLWPIYIASIQILSAEIGGGRRIGLVAALNEAVKFWPRIATLCVFVYGVFFLLTIFALAVAVMIVAGASSLAVIFFALALLAIQIWMFGRFFINVLFWQQFAVLENAGVVDSLRESRNLARSGHSLPWFQRPLWRGALLVSIWTAFVLAITLGPEWSTLRHYFNELTTTQDPQALLQRLTATQQAHGFDIFHFALNLLQRILQPLIGIAFVVLYFDSKSDRHGDPDSAHGDRY